MISHPEYARKRLQETAERLHALACAKTLPVGELLVSDEAGAPASRGA